MAIIPLFRFVIFLLITLFSLVVLGISAHILYLVSGFVDVYTSFAPFGLGVSCVTIIALPLFLALGNLRRRVFTSMILFEIIWFLILWVLWVGVASDTVAGKAWYYPEGCVFNDYPEANQICNEVTVLEAFAFLNFFCAFIYYDVIFLYAIINTIRGRGIWTASVKEATTGGPGTVNPGLPVVQPQFNPAPVTQNYGTYLPNAPPAQPYNAYPQQGAPQGLPYTAYPQQAPPQGQGPPPDQYSAYPRQASPQGPPSQQYGAYPPQAPPQGSPTSPPIQNKPYNYPPAPGTQQQVGYSPSPTYAALPPQPNYSSYPADGSQAPLPLPSGYQGQPNLQMPSQFPMPM